MNKSIEQEWENYKNKVHHGKLNPLQEREVKAGFYAGVWLGLCYAKVAIETKGRRDIVTKIHDLIRECAAFAEAMLKDDIRNN